MERVSFRRTEKEKVKNLNNVPQNPLKLLFRHLEDHVDMPDSGREASRLCTYFRCSFVTGIPDRIYRA